jgi:hypothetical protein
MGRARLASATAFNLLQDNGNFDQQEIRSQIIADGLINIPVPDKLPRTAKQKQEAKFWHQTIGNQPVTGNNGNSQKDKPTEPESVKNPKAPSGGGEGDIKKLSFTSKIDRLSVDNAIRDLVNKTVPTLFEVFDLSQEDNLPVYHREVSESLFGEDLYGLQQVAKSILTKPLIKLSTESQVDLSGVHEFLAKSIVYNIGEVVFGGTTDYDEIILQTQLLVNRSLDDYIQNYVQAEASQYQDMENAKVQRSITEQSRISEDAEKMAREDKLVQALNNLYEVQKSHPVIHVDVESPPITVNMPSAPSYAPKAEDEMKVIINNPQSVNMESDSQAQAMKSMTDTLSTVKRALDTVNTPNITVQVNPTPVTVQNDVTVDVPASPAPEVTVNVEPTPVTVQNNNQIDVTVPEPKSDPKTITIVKNGNTWTGESK